jgi:hypothetical protein
VSKFDAAKAAGYSINRHKILPYFVLHRPGRQPIPLYLWKPELREDHAIQLLEDSGMSIATTDYEWVFRYWAMLLLVVMKVDTFKRPLLESIYAAACIKGERL